MDQHVSPLSDAICSFFARRMNDREWIGFDFGSLGKRSAPRDRQQWEGGRKRDTSLLRSFGGSEETPEDWEALRLSQTSG